MIPTKDSARAILAALPPCGKSEELRCAMALFAGWSAPPVGYGGPWWAGWGIPDNSGYNDTPPHYESDLQAVYDSLVPRARELGWEVNLKTRTWSEGYNAWLWRGKPTEEQFVALAVDPAMAVCSAIYKMLEWGPR